ncbi:MAG: methylenetetrahydrofolate reductase [Egibacteraceae bacterium]
MTDDTSAALARSFAKLRYEIIPTKGVGEQVAHLPADATVTITSSPTKGLEATLALAEELADRGFRVVPHLAARLVRDRGHLREILQHLADLGLSEAFIVAGDASEPHGPFEGATALLRAMSEIGHQLREVGITGYPESHAFIPDPTTIQAMYDKAPHATYIVSQICYDPVTTAWWIEAVRARGVHLPIWIGLPGVVDRSRLLRISANVGLGDSIRFLGKQSVVVRKLLGGYAPDELVRGLAHCLTEERLNVVGWHLFTFNEVVKTEQWRQRLLASLQGASA